VYNFWCLNRHADKLFVTNLRLTVTYDLLADHAAAGAIDYTSPLQLYIQDDRIPTVPTKSCLFPFLLTLIAVFFAGCSSNQEAIDRAVQQTIEAQRIAVTATQPLASTPEPTATPEQSEPTTEPTVAAQETLTEAVPTATAQSAETDAQVAAEPAASDEVEEAESPLADSYEPVLSEVEPLPCEYDAFQDWDTCTIVATSDDLFSYAQVGDSFVLVNTLIVQRKDEQLTLNWLITYMGEEWIFIRGAIFLYDGQRHIVEVDSLTERYTQVLDGGMVLEILQAPIQSIEALIDMAVADEVQIRLAGDNPGVDKTLSEYERKILLRTLATYEQRGGRLPENRVKLVDLVATQAPSVEQTSVAAPEADASAPSAPAEKDIMTGTCTAEVANLRSGPSLDSEVVGKVTQGTVLEIVDTSQDGGWYQLADENWIAASLVALEGSSLEQESPPAVLPPQIISRFPNSAVSITPYDSPIDLGDYVHWYGCVSFAPPVKYDLEVRNASKIVAEMITYSSSYPTDSLVMRLDSQTGETVGVIYEGPPFEGRKTATIDLPQEVTDYTFFVEGPGCWTARLTATS